MGRLLPGACVCVGAARRIHKRVIRQVGQLQHRGRSRYASFRLVCPKFFESHASQADDEFIIFGESDDTPASDVRVLLH